MKDYYQSLGLSANATKDEIKHAHRQLSKKFHPDLNNGSMAAEEKFKEIQEAYEILYDDTRRTYYDLYNTAGPAVYYTYPSVPHSPPAPRTSTQTLGDFLSDKANRIYTLKATLWFLAGVFTLGFLTYTFSHHEEIHEPKPNKVVTDGVIVYTGTRRVMGWLQCNYTYLYTTNDGMHKWGRSHIKYYDPDTVPEAMLYYGHFPVIYLSALPEVSIMLVTKEDFLRYGENYAAR